MALTLSAFLLPAILWVWWRIRRLEGVVRRQQNEQEEQLSLLLHELIEELELRGDTLITQIERREQGLRAILDQIKLVQSYMESYAAIVRDATPEKADVSTALVREDSEPTSVVSAPAALADELKAASAPTTAVRRQIQELLQQGLATEVIAQRLQVGVGEVEVERNLNQWRENFTDR